MDIPYTVHARPDTGLYNAKIGIWLFLASEVMLFGGLFSAYIFLRVGADYPWPVHDLDVTLGFINTVVLIASSVTVVMAWAMLKLRKFGLYRLNMAITVICAGVFMFNKSLEYKAKFAHYAVKLTDGTMLTGHLPHGYQVHFDGVTELNLTVPVKQSAVTADPVGYVLPFIEGTAPKFKTEGGQEISLDQASFAAVSAEALKKAVADKKGSASIKLIATAPIKFAAKPSEVFGYTDTTITFRDGTVATGKLTDDKMTLEVDGVDARGEVLDDKTTAGLIATWVKAGRKPLSRIAITTSLSLRKATRHVTKAVRPRCRKKHCSSNFIPPHLPQQAKRMVTSMVLRLMRPPKDTAMPTHTTPRWCWKRRTSPSSPTSRPS